MNLFFNVRYFSGPKNILLETFANFWDYTIATIFSDKKRIEKCNFFTFS